MKTLLINPPRWLWVCLWLLPILLWQCAGSRSRLAKTTIVINEDPETEVILITGHGDMDRAIKFYESVFDFKIKREQMGVLDMGWFP